MIKMTDLYWAAGFIEGEGSFGNCAKQPTISAYQKTDEPLLRLQNIFGCGNICYRKHKGTLCEWRVYSRRAAAIMMTLYPLMSARRQEKIEKVLALWKATATRRIQYA